MTAKGIARDGAKRTRAEEHALTLLRFRELTAAWIQMEADLRGQITALTERVDALEQAADAAVQAAQQSQDTKGTAWWQKAAGLIRPALAIWQARRGA